ncbi:cyclin-dependent kinase E-1 [Trifolium repens]|nr:cyclin-dependent kinase E-1 [Trifolium repens]
MDLLAYVMGIIISDPRVSSGAALAGNMPGGHVSNRYVPRPMNVGMQRMHQLQAYNLTSQVGMGSGINPAGIPMQRGVQQQAHQQQQLRRKDQMGMPGYPPQQKSRRM